MIKIEFPADRKDIALAISKALAEIGGGALSAATAVTAMAEVAKDVPTLDEAEQERTERSNALDEAAIEDLKAEEAEEEVVQSGDTSRTDPKGVPYNPQMCANAAKPFYASGKYKDQWKKKGGESGPTQEEYDAWYAGELLKVTTPTTATATQETQIDPSTVWQAPTAADQPKVPANAGELFAWIAEMQTANRITQAQVDAAWQANNLNVGQMFAADPATQGAMAQAVHSTLSAEAQA